MRVGANGSTLIQDACWCTGNRSWSSYTENGPALVGRVLPGHIQVARRLLFDPLSDDDLHHLGDIMTRVRDHMRAQPPRSTAPRKRRPTSPAPAATQGLNQNP